MSSQAPIMNSSDTSRKRYSIPVSQVASQTQSRAPNGSQSRPVIRSQPGASGLDLTRPQHFRQYCSLPQGQQATADAHTCHRTGTIAAPHLQPEQRSEHRAQQRVWPARDSPQRQTPASERSGTGSAFVRRALNGTRVDLRPKPTANGTRNCRQLTPPGLPLPSFENVETSYRGLDVEPAGVCFASSRLRCSYMCCDPLL